MLLQTEHLAIRGGECHSRRSKLVEGRSVLRAVACEAAIARDGAALKLSRHASRGLHAAWRDVGATTLQAMHTAYQSNSTLEPIR